MALDDDLNDDDTDSDASPDSPVVAPAASGSSVNPAVAAYLQKLQAAQNQVKQNQQASGLTSALVQLGHGLSRSQAPVDLSGVQAMAKNDTAPVQNFQAQQQGAQQAIQSQALQDSSDPNSVQSQRLRAVYQPLLKRAGLDPSVLDGLSASEIKAQIQQPLDVANKQQTLETNKQIQADAMKSKNQDRNYDRSQAAQDKTDKDHNNYLTHVEDKEMGWRSDPATTRFDQNLAAVSTADAILARYRGHEDDMSAQDIHALVSDKLKAMTGAAPTEPEIAAQMPNNLYTKAAATKSFFTGAPEPANAGGFVRGMDNYFRDMEAKSLAAVKARQETVAGDPRVTPEERQRLVQIGVPKPVYAENDPSKRASQSSLPHSGKYPPGSVVSVKGKNYMVGPDGDSLVAQ